MASTRLDDVIIPEIFAPYIINRTAELSVLVQSGIITRNPLLDQLVSGGGTTIKMPFWNDLTGESQILDDINPILTDKITADQDLATLLIRAKGWSAHELSGALAGDSPMQAIGELVSQWWARDEQRILISILNGIFASASMQGLWLDAGDPVTGEKISAGLVMSAQQLLGDAFGQLTAIALHSATYTKLRKEGAIVMVPNTTPNVGPRDAIEFPTYLGLRVIMDDGVPTDGTTYTTYLFANGVIARGEGTPVDLTPVETDRQADMSTDRLFNRRAFVLHPMGIKWTGSGIITGPTPTNTELSTGTNWQRVYEIKQIGIVKLTHLIEAP